MSTSDEHHPDHPQDTKTQPPCRSFCHLMAQPCWARWCAGVPRPDPAEKTARCQQLRLGDRIGDATIGAIEPGMIHMIRNGRGAPGLAMPWNPANPQPGGATTPLTLAAQTATSGRTKTQGEAEMSEKNRPDHRRVTRAGCRTGPKLCRVPSHRRSRPAPTARC